MQQNPIEVLRSEGGNSRCVDCGQAGAFCFSPRFAASVATYLLLGALGPFQASYPCEERLVAFVCAVTHIAWDVRCCSWTTVLMGEPGDERFAACCRSGMGVHQPRDSYVSGMQRHSSPFRNAYLTSAVAETRCRLLERPFARGKPAHAPRVAAGV